MITLYSLFLATPAGGRRFVPVHCQTRAELLTRARQLLDQDDTACAVEARFGDNLLFTLDKAPGDQPTI